MLLQHVIVFYVKIELFEVCVAKIPNKMKPKKKEKIGQFVFNLWHNKDSDYGYVDYVTRFKSLVQKWEKVVEVVIMSK